MFNMLGAGSDGSPTVKYAAYGHTKAGMTQLTKTLAKEVAGTNVAVHALSPGMVRPCAFPKSRLPVSSPVRDVH